MTRVAVIGGKGRMGSRHCSTLNSIGVDYQCFDIKDGSSIRDVDTDKFTHFIIATLSIDHADDIRIIRKTTDKPILVEKPAITDKADLDILKDKNLFHGVIRRFDEMTAFVQKWCNEYTCHHIDIFKTYPFPVNFGDYGNVNLDINIHHVDALLQMYPEMIFYNNNKTGKTVGGVSFTTGVNLTGYYNTAGHYHDTGVFYGRDKKYITVDFNGRTICTDYKFHQFPTLPLRSELEGFLSGVKCDASKATEICLNL